MARPRRYSAKPSRKFGGKPDASKMHAELNGSKRTRKEKAAQDCARRFEFVIVAVNNVDYKAIKAEGASYYFDRVKASLKAGLVYSSFGEVPITSKTAVYMVPILERKYAKPVLQAVSVMVDDKLQWKHVPASIQQR